MLERIAAQHRVHWTYALRARARDQTCIPKRVQPVMVRAHASNANRWASEKR